MMRFYALCIAIIAVVNLQNGQISILAENLHPVCNTTECQRFGRSYLQNLDPLGQPCSDFYDYVCSNWGQHNPRPKELILQQLWNVEYSLKLGALHEARKILESNVPSKSNELEQAKFLYRICMSTPYMERTSPSAVWNIMKKIAAFPLLYPRDKAFSNRPFFWEIDELYIQTAGESAFFGMSPRLDEGPTGEIMINLGPLSSPYGSMLRPSGWAIRSELEHYEFFLTKVVGSLVAPDRPNSTEVLQKDISDVIEFREKLNLLIDPYTKNSNMDIMTIQKFQSFYTAHAKSLPTADINWIDIISSMYKNSNNSKNKLIITQQTKVRVDLEYFSQLADILRETDRRTVVNHIHLFFAEKHVEYTSQMKDALLGTVTVSNFYAIITNLKTRWKTCIETNNRRTALAKAYATSHFSPAQKSELRKLFDGTKKVMEKQISLSTWLDPATKKASINKLRNVKANIGYPDSYDSPGASDQTANMDAITFEQMYTHELNRISFSAAALQSPIYNPHLPYVVDFGTVGSQIAREIYNAFDIRGIKYDGREKFWSGNMIREYLMRTQCFTNQYDKYKTTQFRNLKLDRAITLTEDISDVMGLKAAYIGFKEMLEKNNGVCPILPGFERYGCEQLFFIAFANNFCSAPEPGYHELAWFRINQNVPKVKVNLAVANLKEFSTAFGCRPADPLNLKQTCDIWQP